MTFTQITKRTGECRRVPRGTEPVIELTVEDGAYITSVELHEAAWMQSRQGFNRATVDWLWTAYVVHPLGPVE